MAQSFVAYYRVSTQKQGISGLGMDAQKAAVAAFTSGNSIIGEFIEVESGKRNDRPQLAEALAMCKKTKATLVIAKIDRLARNVAFIANLMEGKVDFIACDMPKASKLTIHIMAAMAEHEREMISERTKAALNQVKLQLERDGSRISKAGRVFTSLGNPRSAEALLEAQKYKRKVPIDVKKLIVESRFNGLTLQQIADKLNGLGIKTPQNKTWWPKSIQNQL